jgi:kynurenine 3-monooxygenase
METRKINIAGAGLVGSLLSVYLKQKGHDVSVYERRPDMRKTTLDGGRSINLALSDRGWKALEGVGLADDIKKMSIPMYRRVMHAVDGTLSFQSYGKENQAIYSVSRGGLNARLMQLAEEQGVNFHFNEKCTGADLNKGLASFQNYVSGEESTVDGDFLFGADGAFSAIRAQMQKTDRFSYSQEYIEHGYKELSIPPDAQGNFRIEKNALHIWPRGSYMLIALPNPDGSFTCTLFFPFEGENSFESLQSVSDARGFFEQQFGDALALMPNFDEEWEENPTSSLVIIRCEPWVRGNTVLIGDASHAIVPFYGQGMNSGFEDCTVLNELLEKHGDNWEVLLNEFQQLRKPDGEAIADLAMRNFVEMRDLTGQPEFLLQKKIEAKFSAKHPDKWVPLYSMVTFSHTRYSEALRIGKKQDGIMEQIMALPDIENKWDSPEVEEMMLSRI